MARKKTKNVQKELSLIEEIILINARRDYLKNRLDRMKTGNLIERVREALSEVEAARSAKDDKNIKTAINRLGKLINMGVSHDKIWQELYALIDRKVQLVDAEATRQLAEQYRKFQEAMPELMISFNEVLDLYVPEPDARKAIQAKIKELFGVNKGSWDNPYEA